MGGFGGRAEGGPYHAVPSERKNATPALFHERLTKFHENLTMQNYHSTISKGRDLDLDTKTFQQATTQLCSVFDRFLRGTVRV